MGKRARKVFGKLLVMLPFALLVSFIMTGFNSYGTAIIFGIVLAGLLIFVNVFDYDKYDKLKTADYLESKHETTLDYEPAVWARIRSIFSDQLDIDAKVTEDNKDRIKVSLNSSLLKPEVIAERASDKIRLSIQYRYLKFVPDNAKNYRTLTRLKNKIKTPPNIT